METRATRSVEMAEAISGTARRLTELATFDTGATKAAALASMQATMVLINDIVSILIVTRVAAQARRHLAVATLCVEAVHAPTTR